MENGRVKLTEIVFKEGNMFVSYTPELDVSSCGDTAADAKKNLSEAVALFVEEAARMGTLNDILCEQGFTEKHKLWTPPKLVATGSIEVLLPAGA